MFEKLKSLFRKDEPWYMQYEKKSWQEILHTKFINFVCYLIYDKNCFWLEKFINVLAMIEMSFKLDKELQEDLANPDASYRLPDGTYTTPSIKQIVPEHTFYCEGCPCREHSKVADFFYGYQSAGFCYYLNRGDFSITNPTDILWDGCKECGINEDLDEDELVLPDLEPTNQVKAPSEVPSKELSNVENLSGNNARFN